MSDACKSFNLFLPVLNYYTQAN